MFTTNLMDVNRIVAEYKAMWRIETIFRVQGESKIMSKYKDIRVRYFQFAYEQLIEALWYLYYKEYPFKRFLIDLSDLCTGIVDKSK